MRRNMNRMAMVPSRGGNRNSYRWPLMASIVLTASGFASGIGDENRETGSDGVIVPWETTLQRRGMGENGISLRIDSSAYRASLASEVEWSADLCNAGPEFKLIYDGFRWGVSRGVVVYKREIQEKEASLIDVQHSMPPPQSISSITNYKRLDAGECMHLTLTGVAEELLGGPGVYRLMARGIPYANDSGEFESSPDASHVWTLEQGLVESNVIEIVVEE